MIFDPTTASRARLLRAGWYPRVIKQLLSASAHVSKLKNFKELFYCYSPSRSSHFFTNPASFHRASKQSAGNRAAVRKNIQQWDQILLRRVKCGLKGILFRCAFVFFLTWINFRSVVIRAKKRTLRHRSRKSTRLS